MTTWIRKSRAGKSLFALAMLLALSLRILIPTGFMPTATASGVVIALCSEADGKTVALDLGRKVPSEKQHTAGSPCVFAAGLGQGALTASELPTTLPFIYGLTIFVGTFIADLTVNRLAAPPPPSQGPPALS